MNLKSTKYRFQKEGEDMYINQMLNEYVTVNGIKQIYISKKTGIDTNVEDKGADGAVRRCRLRLVLHH